MRDTQTLLGKDKMEATKNLKIQRLFMRGKNHICKITERKIREVKKLLEQFSPLPPKHSERPIEALSLRDISRKTGISFYTVWCIKEGKYDKPEPLQVRECAKGFFNVNELPCWITGWAIELSVGTKRKLIA